jgi:TonB family protein
MDAEERRIWSSLQMAGQDDPSVLRGVVNRYYDAVFRHVAGRLCNDRVIDNDAILDVCDATFRSFIQRARTNRTWEPDSLLELLRTIANEKITAFFSVLPFTSTPQHDSAETLDRILSSVRQSYAQRRTKLELDENGKRPRRHRRWARFIPFASMRSKMVRFGLLFLLVGVFSQTGPLKNYALLLTPFRSSTEPATVTPRNHTLATVSNAAREEGRKPWLGAKLSSPRLKVGSEAKRVDAGSGEARRGSASPATKRTHTSGGQAASKKTASLRNAGLATRVMGKVMASTASGAASSRSSSNAFLASLRTAGEEPASELSSAKKKSPTSPPRHPRDPRLVHEIVLAHSPAIQDCYKLALKRRPDLQGKLVVRFTISTDGRVTNAEIVSSTIQDEQLVRCVLKRIRRWNDFPPAPDEYGDVRFVQEYKFGIE